MHVPGLEEMQLLVLLTKAPESLEFVLKRATENEGGHDWPN